MAKIDDFKAFVKDNPRLIKYVRDGSMNWQKFYEMYDLYGSDGEVWNDYITDTANVVAEATTGGVGITDFFKFLKGVDLDSIQNGVSSLQRVLGVVQDLTNKDSNTISTEEYKPRPVYKHFED